MDAIVSIVFTLACVGAAIYFFSAAIRDWKRRPPSTKPVVRAKAPPPPAPVAPHPVAPDPVTLEPVPAPPPEAHPPARVRAGGHPNGDLGALARMLGWGVGIAVILGTLAIVVMAVTDPKTKAEQQALLKARRVCPPVVSVPTRPIGFPADDVLNVRPGMTWRDAEETLKCVSEDYEIKRKTFTSTVTGKGKQSRPVMQAVRGQETISVAFFGSEGQERAAAMWQDKFYDVGEGPARQSIEGELIAHYGTPHEARDQTTNQRTLTWTFAPDGRPLRVKPKEGDIGAALDWGSYWAAGFTVAACIKNAKLDPAETPTWDGRCGLTIKAEIDSAMGDPRRTARWRVVVLEQQALARYAAPLRALAAPAATK